MVTTIAIDWKPRRSKSGGLRAHHIVFQRVADVQRLRWRRVEVRHRSVEWLAGGFGWDRLASIDASFEGIVDIERIEFYLLRLPPTVRDETDVTVLARSFQCFRRTGSKGHIGVVGRIVVGASE